MYKYKAIKAYSILNTIILKISETVFSSTLDYPQNKRNSVDSYLYSIVITLFININLSEMDLFTHARLLVLHNYEIRT